MLVYDSGVGTRAIATFVSGKVLDVAAMATTDRGAVQQWDDHGGANQRWYVDPCGAEMYRLVAKHSGRVLDIAGPGPAGSQVWQFAWAAADNQRWRVEPAADGGVVITSVWNTDLALDIAGPSDRNGAGLIVSHRQGVPSQTFRLI